MEPVRDTGQEEAFVRAFIQRTKRDRYLEALAHPKRRNKILNRLNHSWDFDDRFVELIDKRDDCPEGLLQVLLRKGAKASASTYMFADEPEFDQHTLPLDQAVEAVYEACFGVVLCVVPGKLAFVRQEEPGPGFLLVRPSPVPECS